MRANPCHWQNTCADAILLMLPVFTVLLGQRDIFVCYIHNFIKTIVTLFQNSELSYIDRDSCSIIIHNNMYNNNNYILIVAILCYKMYFF